MSLKITLLIPLNDNDGEPFDLIIWSWWNDALTELVSGFTDLGVVTGWWRGFSDQNRIIVVIVKTMREVDALRELLREARRRFRQEAMYFEYHEVMFEEVT
jgi:hypothetical protein